MSFLPNDYAPPKGESRYYKFEDGQNRIRILTDAVVGWEYWVTEDGKRKPVRVKTLEEIPADVKAKDMKKDSKEKIKFFWLVLIWDYKTEGYKVLEITQRSIQKDLETLVGDADWGDPKDYDIVVNRSGKDLETEYSVTPKPKSVFENRIDQPMTKLDNIFTGEELFLL